ncbi:hypothetical protein ACTRXD_02935 [Nitrospira sp. T9]|uniref:hypothetical protein n=1 Tax=unclassified Nitrospira TaxID=2652172 RepID=UPI003F962C8D
MSTEIKFLPDKILQVVGSMSDFILQYALALTATSVLAVALLEAWKSLRKTRERFLMHQLYRWISKGRMPPNYEGPYKFHDQVYRQLVLLTTGQDLDPRYALDRIQGGRFKLDPSNALFALEIERMMGQIQGAADIVLSNPAVYPEFYSFLTLGASEYDINLWQVESRRVPHETENSQTMKDRVDAFSRLSQFVKRRLDSLQITMNYQWANWNQLRSIVLGAVLLFISLAYIEISMSALNLINPLTWLRIFIASLVGGIVAPVAKDLVVALKKVREGG